MKWSGISQSTKMKDALVSGNLTLQTDSGRYTQSATAIPFLYIGANCVYVALGGAKSSILAMN
jgi:hypothetical protein